MRVREKLSVDEKKLEQYGKSLEDRVGEILANAVKQCDKVVNDAKKEAEEILSTYGGELIIQNHIEWNILDKMNEKAKKGKKSK